MLPLAIPAAIKALPWRFIGPALGIVAVLTLAYCSGRSDVRKADRAALVVERGNVAVLKDGLADQNAGIAAQGMAAAVVAKASAKAVQRGAERRGRVDAAAARVEAVQPSVACGAVPDDVRALWGNL